MRGKVSMRKLREVFRLGLVQGLSQRDIATSTGLSKTAVQGVLTRAKEKALTWELAESMTECEIISLLYPTPPNSSQKRSEPDWSKIHVELMKKGVTLSLLWLEYKCENSEGVQYSRFCEIYRDWEKLSCLTMCQRHKAGEKLFVDFSGLTVPYLNLDSNEIQYAQIFVAVLGASNYTFSLAVESQSLSAWVECHVRTFGFFGGVPAVLVPDNLKSGVTKVCRYEPDINPTYHALARHYGTAIIPARSRKPRDKGKVEVGVQIVQRWILACLRKMTFTSVGEINAAITPLLERLNNKVMRKFKDSRINLFNSLEKVALKALPDRHFEMEFWKKAKINPDYHVEIDNHYYSTPWKMVGQKVEIRMTSSSVEIFLASELIAVHTRKFTAGEHSTTEEHRPPSHRAHAELTQENILKQASNIGSSTALLCDEIIKNATHPEQGLRSCLGIVRLTKIYPSERIEDACLRGLKLKSPSYKSIKSILQNNLDKLAVTPINKPIAHMDHENIRGAEYYH